VEDGQNSDANGILIEGFGKDRAPLHASIPPIQNTGYFIANKLFYPGDNFINPQKSIEIFALPIAGPWTKLPEGIDYAIGLKPKTCFPVHDGGLKQLGTTNRIPPQILEPLGIKFEILEIGKETEF